MITKFMLAVCMSIPCYLAADEARIVSFEGQTVPSNMKCGGSQASLEKSDRGQALKVVFSKTDWPNVAFSPPSGTWDWSANAGISLDIFNPEAKDQDVQVRVDNEGADGVSNCNTGSAKARPGKWTTLRLEFNTSAPADLWGMRGTPSAAGRPGPTIDPKRITSFQVFLARPSQEHTLLIDNIRLFGTPREAFSMPFIDRFGQYKLGDWPGKLKSENELSDRRKAEEAALKSAAVLPGLDKYGGWADGPKLDATGWFRTEKYNGKWWLVDPEGHLFFSVGMDCVRLGDFTFAEGRDKWFEWLPDAAGEFAAAVGHANSSHSMAQKIGGKGKTVSFYRANLIRKYGPDWQAKAREAAYARLKAWGFNTIANWSDASFMAGSPIPYTGTLSVSGNLRRIAGDNGYWGKMMDVYAPGFEGLVEQCVAGPADKRSTDPMCIGYFVDNELSWNGIESSTLASPPDQPCRVEFVRRLKERYQTVDALNKAWETDAKDWDSLRAPGRRNKAAQEDLDGFVYAFARRYFDTVSAAVKKHAPDQLYLGCRFAWYNPTVVRACADVADVVSFNRYAKGINRSDWTGKNDLGKPLIIGEFHFGALDRGMFHAGLGPTGSQQERAESFKKYVRSVEDCPAFVGCHWFEYIDEPNTGRCLDGENYNIGFVDVTDTPYPEMVEAAKETGAEVYSRRAGK